MLGDCAYIIESGSVEVSRALPNGERQTLGILKANDIFGEMSLIDALPRSATVTALEDCLVVAMTLETFNSLAQHNPGALMPVLKVLAARLRRALDNLENLEGDKTIT